MKIHNGDHAEFEIQHANLRPQDRPDWPLPSFDANDWAIAFCNRHQGFDVDTARAWFANALMRGYDEGRYTPRASSSGGTPIPATSTADLAAA